MRCSHGFETTVVPCPEGCVSKEPTAPRPRRYIGGSEYGEKRAASATLTEARIAAALNASDSVAEAARQLGVSRNALARRAGSNPELMALLEAKSAPTKFRAEPRQPHSGFVDMTDQTRAGCRIIRRAANTNGNARWFCQLACGHEGIVEGIVIRDAERNGRTVRCPDCRPKRPGTVQRRAHG